MGPVRVVFDTNVYVSAIGFGGTPLDAVLRAFDDDVQLVASENTLDELARVMTYDRLPFTDDDREQYLAILDREVDLVSPDESITAITDDPTDNMFLECAVEGDSVFVVTGDDHLLDLGTFRDVDIVTASTFVRRVGDGADR